MKWPLSRTTVWFKRTNTDSQRHALSSSQVDQTEQNMVSVHLRLSRHSIKRSRMGRANFKSGWLKQRLILLSNWDIHSLQHFIQSPFSYYSKHFFTGRVKECLMEVFSFYICSLSILASAIQRSNIINKMKVIGSGSVFIGFSKSYSSYEHKKNIYSVVKLFQ